MRRRTLRNLLLIGLPLAAALAIPGEAVSVGAQDRAGLPPDDTALRQGRFGFLLDPHVEPVLVFTPTATIGDP